MTPHLIDLRQARQPAADDLPGLQGYLTQLVGEPFRFARVSYGEELTLHFGDLRPARSPKLKDKPYGAYILGVRGSPWIVKSGSEPLVLSAGINLDNLRDGFGTPVNKEQLETNPVIQPGSRVASVTPFVVQPVNGYGLQLRFTDGSTLLILPTPPEETAEATAEPNVADWELASPVGLLSAGPGLTWSFAPSSK